MIQSQLKSFGRVGQRSRPSSDSSTLGFDYFKRALHPRCSTENPFDINGLSHLFFVNQNLTSSQLLSECEDLGLLGTGSASGSAATTSNEINPLPVDSTTVRSFLALAQYFWGKSEQALTQVAIEIIT